MTSVPVGDLERFCLQADLALPLEMQRIRAGRNSEVSRLVNRDGNWILKRYYQHGSDTRDRLGTEFGFLQFLTRAGVAGVCRPLRQDKPLGVGLYSCLPGTRPATVTSGHIAQAARFIGRIDDVREADGASALPLAADACLSWLDHLNLTDTRIGRLMSLTPQSPLALEAHRFVEQHLLAHWTMLKGSLLAELQSSGLSDPLPLHDRIISPSDFGFHNALEDQGSLSFVDFEYAGWDDPAKLVCDFICQPELPVSDAQGGQFLQQVAAGLARPDVVRYRIERLLPVHRLKWCCILLNEFRSEDRGRRLHSAGTEPEALLADQLRKAQNYFKAHLASLN